MGDDYLNTMCIIRDEAGEKRWVDLKARVVEHNIRSVRFMQHTSTYPTAQDDGPVLHKDPSWSHGDFAGAHRGRNWGLPLRHGRKTPKCYEKWRCKDVWNIQSKSNPKVVAGTVSAKTDRLEGIVDFTEQQVRLTKPRLLNCSLSWLPFLFETPSFVRTPWKTLTHGVTTQTSWWTWWWRPPTSSTRRRWWALDRELVNIRTWPRPGSQNSGSRSCGSGRVIYLCWY